LAFVLIMVFWGVVNLLTSSLGLTKLGQTTARCFDYDPDCDISVAVQTDNGDSPTQPTYAGNQAGDPYAPVGINTDGFGNEFSPDVELPDIDADTTPNTSSPGQMQIEAPQLDIGFDPVSSISTQSEDVIRAALDPVIKEVVENYLPDIQNDLLEIEMYHLAKDSVSDTERIQLLRSFDEAGIIEEGSYFAAADNVNDVYEANDGERVSMAVDDFSNYTDAIVRYAQAVQRDIERSNNYAVSIGLNNQTELAVTANDLYSYSESNSLVTNVENAYQKYNLLTGTQSGLSEREDFITDFITATNVYIERTGDNSGVPITRADVLGD
jgi:hypothetical protein